MPEKDPLAKILNIGTLSLIGYVLKAGVIGSKVGSRGRQKATEKLGKQNLKQKLGKVGRPLKDSKPSKGKLIGGQLPVIRPPSFTKLWFKNLFIDLGLLTDKPSIANAAIVPKPDPLTDKIAENDALSAMKSLGVSKADARLLLVKARKHCPLAVSTEQLVKAMLSVM